MIDAVAVCHDCGKVRKDCKCVHVIICTRKRCKKKAVYRGIVGNLSVLSCAKHVNEIDKTELIEQ